MQRYTLFIFTFFIGVQLHCQIQVQGRVKLSAGFQGSCIVGVKELNSVVSVDSSLVFEFVIKRPGTYTTTCYCEGYEPVKMLYSFSKATEILEFAPLLKQHELREVYAAATAKESYKLNSPIVTDVYEKAYFEKNPVSNLLDVMDRVNGVKTQVNCNVCGTADIHINGMEGPYSLVVLDGVPMVGGLSTVYGLAGIPTFLIDKIEVTKGPASSVYGSEAVAGVIHVYTKRAEGKPQLFLQQNTSTHGEIMNDVGLLLRHGKRWQSFTGFSHFWMNQELDKNRDSFTDVALQQRISAFQRWSFSRPENKVFDISGRLLRENRWGGELNWKPQFLGGDSVYAEVIETERYELNLAYQLPVKEKFLFLSHAHFHKQNSHYGQTPFFAKQGLSFSQLTWEKRVKRHALLVGGAFRMTHYNDNTGLTLQGEEKEIDKPMLFFNSGIFLEDTWTLHENHKLLTSFRMDYQREHGFVPTPRLAYWLKLSRFQSLRVHLGSGFRAVNLFSEDHAALTGARTVEITEKLRPEKSYSINSSYTSLFFLNEKWTLEATLGLFYTYFSNRIVADYVSDPDKIIFQNSADFSEIYGTNIDFVLKKGTTFSAQLGITRKEVLVLENEMRTQQMLTEKWSGNWTLSYAFAGKPLKFDYTGNFSGSMRLPVGSEMDPRPSFSKPYSIHNLQVTYAFSERFQLFLGVKNLLNWTPANGLPFLIARAHDPFDKEVEFDATGSIIATDQNPYALSFDPSYVFAQNQGTRYFLGFRWNPSFEKKSKQ